MPVKQPPDLNNATITYILNLNHKKFRFRLDKKKPDENNEYITFGSVVFRPRARETVNQSLFELHNLIVKKAKDKPKTILWRHWAETVASKNKNFRKHLQNEIDTIEDIVKAPLTNSEMETFCFQMFRGLLPALIRFTVRRDQIIRTDADARRIYY